MAKELKCPECHSKQVWKVGAYRTRKGVRQRYQCKKCARTFYDPDSKPRK